MRPSSLDTSDIATADQYGWYATQLETIFGLQLEPDGRASGPYRAAINVRSLPPLTYLRFAAEGDALVRSATQSRQVAWNCYCLYRELGEGVVFDFSGRPVLTARGDLVIYDGDAPMRAKARSTYDHVLWMLPRKTFDAHLPPMPRPLVVHLPADAGIMSLATAYLDALADPAANLTEQQTAMVADNLARLIAIACGRSALPSDDVARSARLEQVKAFVEQHLTAPGLDPKMAAAALGVSLRQIHVLFVAAGESFGAFVRRRRLQECRATLENPLAASRSIADIAFGWGFASLPTFYRAFQSAFGTTPSEVRETALAGMLRDLR
ncbi:hypothetical protein sos41_07160 [Alphaproteobacteria bacterium SO-S41]|nr:hypothetical protein sos41_07160 [Alphaproteobacteria bacterium SO-S41]